MSHTQSVSIHEHVFACCLFPFNSKSNFQEDSFPSLVSLCIASSSPHEDSPEDICLSPIAWKQVATSFLGLSKDDASVLLQSYHLIQKISISQSSSSIKSRDGVESVHPSRSSTLQSYSLSTSPIHTYDFIVFLFTVLFQNSKRHASKVYSSVLNQRDGWPQHTECQYTTMSAAQTILSPVSAMGTPQSPSRAISSPPQLPPSPRHTSSPATSFPQSSIHTSVDQHSDSSVDPDRRPLREVVQFLMDSIRTLLGAMALPPGVNGQVDARKLRLTLRQLKSLSLILDMDIELFFKSVAGEDADSALVVDLCDALLALISSDLVRSSPTKHIDHIERRSSITILPNVTSDTAPCLSTPHVSLPVVELSNCRNSVIYVLGTASSVIITGCQHLTIVLGAVAGPVLVHNCHRLRLSVVAGGLRVMGSSECVLNASLVTPLVVQSGSCHNIQFGPFNARMQGLHAAVRLGGVEEATDRFIDSVVEMTPLGASPSVHGSGVIDSSSSKTSTSWSQIHPDEYELHAIPVKLPDMPPVGKHIYLPPMYVEAARQRQARLVELRRRVQMAGLSSSQLEDFEEGTRLLFNHWLRERGRGKEIGCVVAAMGHAHGSGQK